MLTALLCSTQHAQHQRSRSATFACIAAIFCILLQALVTALDLPWEEASHLLKHAGGDLSAAFKNELSAYHLNEKLLDELVWEYAAHRFVVDHSAPCSSGV